MAFLYYDASCGISGDMNIAALLDLGVSFDHLKSELDKLGLNDEYELEFKSVKKRGISASKFNVLLKKHTHERSFKSIKELIESSNLNQNVKEISIKIFKTIAIAEAKVHGVSMNTVHFHEIGATDSIVDIVGAAICFDALNVDKIYSSRVELGGGSVKCAHGELSVPAPAVSEILTHVPVSIGKAEFELTTPTGAGILKSLAIFRQKADINIIKTGYGAGGKDMPHANILKVMLCKEEYEENHVANTMIEANLDDMSAEEMAFATKILLKNGALDVFLTPIIMKKSRAGVKLSVLCKNKDVLNLKELIFKHTSSIGVREYLVSKTELSRKIEKISTKYGEISVKISTFEGMEKIKPEFDECEAAAIKFNISIQEIKDEVMRAYKTRTT
ncbi:MULTISPECIES: nickel pincer cofactor biosynthesis protein LarC [Campylobacter]|uniref:nickel pincer cofactor biosynthesis protein LarC n=1 Tax=Campylobacter TaxID=194 RepID=UPI001474A5DD|nr:MULTISPECIES: nickel pincer cofactor biosynthesis protein LarC [unclassified Campylobacter]MBE3021814.1 nickel pincer cofactor biosynthesis protein LarC [Campylobacter sp. 7477a]MBE3609406.1 nickel pincer cofactor biosynthesis protein LarC [Campylobacter sp. RM12916]